MWPRQLILDWQALTVFNSFASLNLINPCSTLLIIRIKSVLIINIHEYLLEHKLRNVNKREFLAEGADDEKLYYQNIFCLNFILEKCSYNINRCIMCS